MSNNFNQDITKNIFSNMYVSNKLSHLLETSHIYIWTFIYAHFPSLLLYSSYLVAWAVKYAVNSA